MLVWEKINMALNSISKLIFYAKDLVQPITNRYVCPSHIMMNLSWTFLLSWDFLWCRNRRFPEKSCDLWHHTPSHSFQLLSIIESWNGCYDETLFFKKLVYLSLGVCVCKACFSCAKLDLYQSPFGLNWAFSFWVAMTSTHGPQENNNSI